MGNLESFEPTIKKLLKNEEQQGVSAQNIPFVPSNALNQEQKHENGNLANNNRGPAQLQDSVLDKITGAKKPIRVLNMMPELVQQQKNPHFLAQQQDLLQQLQIPTLSPFHFNPALYNMGGNQAPYYGSLGSEYGFPQLQKGVEDVIQSFMNYQSSIGQVPTNMGTQMLNPFEPSKTRESYYMRKQCKQCRNKEIQR